MLDSVAIALVTGRQDTASSLGNWHAPLPGWTAFQCQSLGYWDDFIVQKSCCIFSFSKQIVIYLSNFLKIFLDLTFNTEFLKLLLHSSSQAVMCSDGNSETNTSRHGKLTYQTWKNGTVGKQCFFFFLAKNILLTCDFLFLNFF